MYECHEGPNRATRVAGAFVWIVAGVITAGLMASGLSGCRAASSPRRQEPLVIVVYNNSPVGLRIVSLRAVSDSGSEPVRIGSVSPVPRGTSQVFGRPSNAPPFPRVAEISWTDDLGQDYTQKVVLEAVLQDATGEPGEALVVEIRAAGRLAVYLKGR